ncbi:MAG: CocE/NonD family hydrolase [Spirochaetes bacterium]|nr:CocE/NonD family hydrolase [Spirochaetota bacterium]
MKSKIVTAGKFILLGLTVIICLGAVLLCLRDAPDLKLSSSPGFEPEGISPAEYTGYRKESRYLTMPDGVKLAVDFFIPSEGPEKKRFPVIFEYSPYNRASVYFNLSLKMKVLSKWYTGTWGPIFDASKKRISRQLIARGYAYVIADMRGTGASFGAHIPLDPQLAKDGKVIVDWIAAQEWCDGNIGMNGQSYLGWSQWAVAAERPKALKCIAPALIMAETYTGANRPGGITAVSWLKHYSDFLQDVNHNAFEPTRSIPVLPCVPVIDEDGDGKLEDEIPLMSGNDERRFTDDGEPRYADGVARKENIYYRATMQHLKNVRPDTIAEKYPYINDSITGTAGIISFRDTSPGYFLRKVRKSGIAVLNIGGWFDGFLRGTARLYATIQGANPAYLLIGPRFHQPVAKILQPYKEYLDYEGEWGDQQFIVTLRFFDHYLKGAANGFDREKPVSIHVAHQGWRKEGEWPLARQRTAMFYFGPAKSLGEKPPSEGKDAYPVDFTHASDYGEPQLNRWVMTKPSRELMRRTAHDGKCFVYETAALTDDVEVTGHPIVNLYLSSDRPDADVFAYICDVDDRGESVYVTEGQMRAGWHPLYPDDKQVNGAVDIKPDLPWHGYERNRYVKNPLEGGRVIELRFDLFPMAWVFKKGHKIRLALAGVDAGNFEQNPAFGSAGGEPKPTTLYFHRGGKIASRIELPVIPK